MMFPPPFFSFPNYMNYSRYPYGYSNYPRYSNNKNFHINYDNSKSNPNTTKSKPSKEISEDRNCFEIMGIKLYFDDILLICLIFFLYSEGVQDEMLFLALVLLLLS